MNFNRVVFWDEYVGRLLLRVLSILPPFPQRIREKLKPEKILIVKFLGMGSIIQAIPLIRALKREYLDVPVDILTFSENKPIVESFGFFRCIHNIDFHAGNIKFFMQTIKFILKNRCKYSLIIDLEFFSSFSSLVIKMLGSKHSLGFESFSPSRNRCFSRTIIFDHSKHIRKIFFKIFGCAAH